MEETILQYWDNSTIIAELCDLYNGSTSQGSKIWFLTI